MTQVDIDAAIYVVLNTIDDLLCAGNHAQLDAILPTVDVDRIAPEVMLAWLMGTLRAREWLANRGALVGRVEARLRDVLPEEVEDLLDGLRGTIA